MITRWIRPIFIGKTSKSEQTRSLIPNSAHLFFVNWILVSFYRTLISKHCTIIFTPSLIYGWSKSRWYCSTVDAEEIDGPLFISWIEAIMLLASERVPVRFADGHFPQFPIFTHTLTERCTTQLWKPEWNTYCFYLLESTSKPTTATSTTKKSSQNICL